MFLIWHLAYFVINILFNTCIIINIFLLTTKEIYYFILVMIKFLNGRTLYKSKNWNLWLYKNSRFYKKNNYGEMKKKWLRGIEKKIQVEILILFIIRRLFIYQLGFIYIN